MGWPRTGKDNILRFPLHQHDDGREVVVEGGVPERSLTSRFGRGPGLDLERHSAGRHHRQDGCDLRSRSRTTSRRRRANPRLGGGSQALWAEFGLRFMFALTSSGDGWTRRAFTCLDAGPSCERRARTRQSQNREVAFGSPQDRAMRTGRRLLDDRAGRRKKGFRLKSWKKTPPKKTEFQTGASPPLSSRR